MTHSIVALQHHLISLPLSPHRQNLPLKLRQPTLILLSKLHRLLPLKILRREPLSFRLQPLLFLKVSSLLRS